MLERDFQASVVRELKQRFTGCIVLKNDPNYLQGVPDLLILYKDKWAALECKKDRKATLRSNQGFYIQIMDDMSFGRFIYPENRKEVMDELEQSFKPHREAFTA